MIANHGQKFKYRHDVIGCNSRLDTLQAAILNVKLKMLDKYTAARQEAASLYRHFLKDVNEVILPHESHESTHVYHQFTIRCKQRDMLKDFMEKKGIPSMIYYPYPVHKQPAFRDMVIKRCETPVSDRLSEEVLSLPMHTELVPEQQSYIADTIKQFYKN